MNTYEKFKEIMLSEEYNSVQKGQEIVSMPLKALKLIDELAEQVKELKKD